MNVPTIEATGLVHHYGVRPVLRGVSLTVADGEIVSIMGPNGMGKSTLLGVIAGMLWPIRGSVRVNGLLRRESEATELAIRQQIAYLPAEPWIPRTRTGRDWLLAVGRVYSVDEDRLREHADRLLDVFDLADRADSHIASYSTGQKKKIAVCAALATDAPILLLDEPFAGGLDPSGILALKRILQAEHSRRSKTVLMATPVPELVEELADRVVIVADGIIQVDDTVEGIKASAGAATLADAYDRLVSPKMLEKIERYLATEAR